VEREKQWHVFYTRSRSEKKVSELLSRRGWDHYLPIVKEVRQWSDRRKVVARPLFNSYIFIKTENHLVSELLQWIPGLVTFVRYNSKPATIREEEINKIQRFVETGLPIEAGSDENLQEGDKVNVFAGPLKGMDGEVINVANQDFFIIRIKAINQYLKIQISKDYLKKTEN
jgi:transcription antitermination factor NusG